MNDEIEQILKNQLTIMNALYYMYYPAAPQITANTGNMLLCNMEQTVDVLGRIHKEK